MPVPETTRFQRYLSVISRWFLVLGLTFVFAKFAGNFIIHHVLPQKYTAVAEMDVLISVLDIPSAAVPSGQPQPTARDFTLQGIKSSQFLLPVIHDLQLSDAWAKRIYKSKEDGLTDEETLSYLDKILRVDVARDTNLVKITVTEDDPKEAAAIANSVADNYKTMRDSEEDQRAKHGFATLKSPVRIISRAEVPTRPDRGAANTLGTIVAAILSVLAASFVEMILLFHRASERTGN